ncbi:YciI family protein [Leisingera sp. M658]|uniref:YciI family protein n=1 Tax=Leisingera sp. M658 TaxID=2867015 RepID=UPI0021A3BB95|nr:YciI family protein [Leisingera sp. M658]UWQ76300.1 YciI family protein [Leisingera sp. M658]
MTAPRETRKTAPALTRWAVMFRDAPAMMDVRASQARRDAHVAYVKDHPELRIGGGLKPDADGDFCGALWIVEAEDRIEVEHLIHGDPFYVPAFRSYEIFTWGKILEDQTATL